MMSWNVICKQKILFLSFISVFIFFSIEAHSQHKGVRYDRMFSGNEVRCITKSDNFLWMGTANGLYVANNGIWKEFKQIENDDEFGQSSIYDIRDLLPYKEKVLISTSSTTMCYDAYSNTISKPLYYKTVRLVADAMSNSDSIAYLYSACLNSLFSYNYDNNSLKLENSFNSIQNVLKNLVCLDKDILLFVDVDGNLLKYDIGAEQLSSVTGLPADVRINDLFLTSEGNLLFSTWNNQVLICSFSTNSSEISVKQSINLDIPKSDRCEIVDIVETDRFMIFSTNGSGLFFISKATQSIELVSDEIAKETKKMCLIDYGHILSTTRLNGLLSFRYSFVNTISGSTITPHYQMAGNSVLMLNQSDNLIEIGTKDGLDIYDCSTGKVRNEFSADLSDILSMCVLDRNNLLAFSKNTGLTVVERKSGERKLFETNSIRHSLVNQNSINTKLVNAKDGRIFILNIDRDNFFYDPEMDQAQHFDFEINNNEYVRPLYVDNNSINYFISSTTLYELDMSSMQTRTLFVLEEPISCAVYGSNSKIYYCQNNKIVEFDPSISSFREVAQLDVDNSIIQCVIMDMEHKLWLATASSWLINLDPETGEYTLFSKQLIDNNNFVNNSQLISNDGILFLSGATGVIMIDPSGYKPNDFDNVSVSLASVVVDDNLAACDKNSVLVLPQSYTVATCNVYVSQPNPSTSVKIHYVLKRKFGFSVIHQEYTYSTSFNLGHLSPGKYSLYSSVLKNDGWSEPEELLEISLRRNPFLSIVSLSIYITILLVLAVLFGLDVKNKYSVKKKHRERKDIDDTSSKIGLMSDASKEACKALQSITEPLNQMRVQNADNQLLNNILTKTIAHINKAYRFSSFAVNVESVVEQNNSITTQEMNLNDSIAGLLMSFNDECNIKGVVLHFDPDLAIQNIQTDINRVNLAVTLLLEHAVSNCNGNKISISTHVISQRYVRISVAYKGTKAVDSEHESGGYVSGLGCVKNIASVLDGRFSYMNKKDSAVMCMFDIPIFTIINYDNQKNEYSNIDSTTLVNTKKMTVLLVDDQRDVTEYIKEVLSEQFKKIIIAHDGLEALVQTKSMHPDAVVSDIMMPNVSGFDFCTALKTDLSISHIPFIAFSSKTESMHQVQFFKQGPDDFIAKPFEINILYQTLRFHIGKRKKIIEDYESGILKRITGNETFSPVDDNFFTKLNGFIDNLSDIDEFDVGKLEAYMELSLKDIESKIETVADTSLKKYVQNILV